MIIISYENTRGDKMWVMCMDDAFLDIHTSSDITNAGHFNHADAKIILKQLRRLGYNNPQGRICGAAWREAAYTHMKAHDQL